MTDPASPQVSQAAEAEGETGERRRGPKVYKVKLALVNTINTEYVQGYVGLRLTEIITLGFCGGSSQESNRMTTTF